MITKKVNLAGVESSKVTLEENKRFQYHNVKEKGVNNV